MVLICLIILFTSMGLPHILEETFQLWGHPLLACQHHSPHTLVFQRRLWRDLIRLQMSQQIEILMLSHKKTFVVVPVLQCPLAPNMVHLLPIQHKFLVLTVSHMEILEIHLILNMAQQSQVQRDSTIECLPVFVSYSYSQ